ncbi:hypothetical protein G3578_09120 [Brevibacillus sp. SYP-B805]|uniref:hypothetical protein n=1 Tax=Brevibacillus sp. SYP-B805 TaxID=1578199 RepID=UPI0013E9F6A9|nr:hypothetical protein [Brevibacillus sp. SYP-B805]NGQ95314.1 hypothetical protein [Brevibacillus sp. SYP-B805]
MGKKLIIKGVGTMMAKRVNCDSPTPGEELITLGTLQSLRIDLNVEVEDIFGGDGLFSIDQIIKSKSIEVTATDAKFDLAAVQLLMGGNITDVSSGDDAYLWSLNELKNTDASGVSGALKHDVKPGKESEMVVRNVKSGRLLRYTTNAVPGADEFIYDPAAKVIKVGSNHVGSDIYVNYMYEATVEALFLQKDEIPITVSIVHHGYYVQKCGTKRGIETELYACRPSGQFSLDAQRATASSSSITLKLIDPERPDGRLGSIKVFEAA